MKQEPELIDIFALFAMMSILRTANKSALPQDIARSSYEFAEAMMEEREDRDL
jgi:hypothetical protein